MSVANVRGLALHPLPCTVIVLTLVTMVADQAGIKDFLAGQAESRRRVLLDRATVALLLS